MPYGRQLRSDRRRRVMRDSILRNSPEPVAPRTSSRPTRTERTTNDTSAPAPVALVGYSQEVRGPCQQRLVHFIPVRPATLAAVISGVLIAVGVLIGLHYAVWIAGPDSWRSTPLSLLLDVRSRVGLAGWINVQLWLITAILCGMTFQIRKHRLDDYRAHYRVWLWLALASLLASVEAGTGLTQVLAASMERFGRLNFGWSGRTLVEISIATAVGMLALRICSELKASPVSQVLWLIGLVCWVPAALLASQLIKTTIRPDYAHLWIGALWIVGKTFVMLAALIYLRQVYIAAQRRFVERSRLVQTAWKMTWPKFRRDGSEEMDQEEAPVRKPTRRRRAEQSESKMEDAESANSETGDEKPKRRRLPKIRWSAFSSWVASSMPKMRLPRLSMKRNKAKSAEQEEGDDAVMQSRSEVSKLPPKSTSPAKPATAEPKPEKAKRRFRIPKPNLSSLFAFRKWIRLPKLSSLNPLSRMRLKPPTADDAGSTAVEKGGDKTTANPATATRGNGPLPSTSPAQRPTTSSAAPASQARPNSTPPSSQNSRPANIQDEDDDDDDADGGDRKLSKAERKRLKRLQQEQRRNAA
jgi:hypothetical protein